jgi:hypothetical protein
LIKARRRRWKCRGDWRRGCSPLREQIDFGVVGADAVAEQQKILARRPAGEAVRDVRVDGARLTGSEFAVDQQRDLLCPFAARHLSQTPDSPLNSFLAGVAARR